MQWVRARICFGSNNSIIAEGTLSTQVGLVLSPLSLRIAVWALSTIPSSLETKSRSPLCSLHSSPSPPSPSPSPSPPPHPTSRSLPTTSNSSQATIGGQKFISLQCRLGERGCTLAHHQDALERSRVSIAVAFDVFRQSPNHGISLQPL